MKRNKHIFLALICVNVLIQSLSGQSFLNHHYTESDGVISSYVLDAVQDKQGDMWFATRIGVSRYDGINWESDYASKEYRNNMIDRLAVDKSGNIWSVSKFPFLFVSHYSKQNWLPFKLTDSLTGIQIIRCFEVSINNNDTLCFIGTNKKGLYYFDGKKWNIASISQIGKSIYAIERSNSGILINSENGIFSFRNGNFIDLNHQLNQRPLMISVENKESLNEKIWIVSENSIDVILNDKIDHKINFALGIDSLMVAEPDNMGGLFFANYLYCWYYDFYTHAVHPIGLKNGFISEGATSIFTDREQNTWITTHRGISKKPVSMFTNYSAKDGLCDNEVTAIDEYLPGKYVFGHNNGISFWDNGITNCFYFPESFTIKKVLRVLDIEHDDRGTIYIAGNQMGFGIMYPNGAITWDNTEIDIKTNFTSVLRDNSGNLWVSTNTQIFLYKNNKLIPQAINKTINKRYLIRKLFTNKKDEIIIATFNNGIIKLTPNGAKRYYCLNSAKANSIYSYLEDDSGTEFIGTLDGLYTLSNDSMVKLKKFDELNQRPIYVIVQQQDIIWFGSDYGLYCWDGKSLLFHNKDNGFGGVETNRSAGLVDSEGTLWIGSDQGLSTLNPMVFSKNTFSTHVPVTIDSISSKNGILSKILTNEIPYDENTLNFYFSGKSFINENNIRYSVKLEGYDNDWSETLLPVFNSKSYTGLPHGKYRFLVKAQNTYGNWSNPVSSPIIVIKKPFYKTIWFVFLMIIIFSMFVVWFYSYYSNKILTTKLKSLVDEKTLQLEESERRYRQMVENTNAVMIIVDPSDYQIIHCNQAAIDYFGFNQKEIYDKNLKDLFISTKEKENYQILSIDKQGYFTNQFIRDESTRNVEVYFSQLDLNETKVCFLIIHDITKRAKFETELQESNKTKDKFLSIISHDLRSPFSSLLGFSEIILHEYHDMSDEERIQNLTTINEVAENTYQLLENLLYWALSQSGKMEYTPRNTNLSEIVDLNIEILSMPIKNKSLNVKSHIDPETKVMADRNMLNTIIRNLLSNAIKFTNSSGSITFDCISTNGSFEISISDNGIGIATNIQQSIFNEGKYHIKRGTLNERGTGLGLNLCKDFIEKHQGKIWVESTPGKGSRFSFTLPDTTQLNSKS